jgi:uncharacterized protein (DUF983 family)
MPIPLGRMLRRGLLGCCPVCGSRSAVHRMVRIDDECPRCGLVFRRDESQGVGAWFINVCVTQVAIVFALFGAVLGTYPNVSVPFLLALGIGTALLVPLTFFASSRMLWTAVDLAMRPLDFDDGVAPGWELEEMHAEKRRRR